MVNAPRDGTLFIAMHENICLQDVVYCGEHNGEQWWFDATSLRPLVRCCENFFVEWSPLGEGMTPPFRASSSRTCSQAHASPIARGCILADQTTIPSQ